MAGGLKLGGDDDEGLNEINVTPLVDVMLVLLIIFMVASTYIVKPSIEIDLPKAASAGEVLDTTLSLILTKDGGILLNGERTSETALAAECRRLSAENPDVQAIVAADGSARHAQVVRLIDLVKTNGVRRFALNITPIDRREAGY